MERDREPGTEVGRGGLRHISEILPEALDQIIDNQTKPRHLDGAFAFPKETT